MIEIQNDALFVFLFYNLFSFLGNIWAHSPLLSKVSYLLSNNKISEDLMTPLFVSDYWIFWLTENNEEEQYLYTWYLYIIEDKNKQKT